MNMDIRTAMRNGRFTNFADKMRPIRRWHVDFKMQTRTLYANSSFLEYISFQAF